MTVVEDGDFRAAAVAEAEPRVEAKGVYLGVLIPKVCFLHFRNGRCFPQIRDRLRQWLREKRLTRSRKRVKSEDTCARIPQRFIQIGPLRIDQPTYRDRLKSVLQGWFILFLLWLITSDSTCMQHSRNLEHRLQPILFNTILSITVPFGRSCSCRRYRVCRPPSRSAGRRGSPRRRGAPRRRATTTRSAANARGACCTTCASPPHGATTLACIAVENKCATDCNVNLLRRHHLEHG